MENSNQNSIVETISFRELANRIGIDDLDTPEIYDIRDQNYEILSFNHETNQKEWHPLNAFVVKKNAAEHYQINTLHGTKDHRIWVDGDYVRLEDYAGAELVNQPIQVVDCEVENTHNYIAEGQINHNTTTPGGMAIPYASSVRIRIQSTGQQHVKDKSGNVIGIKVKAKTIKNRVARPFRECEFSIIFGVGVVEFEEVFDLFRGHCDSVEKSTGAGIPLGDELISVSGTGAWKHFVVKNSKTKETVIEQKYYKADFGDVLYNPEYKKYMDALYVSALLMDPNDMRHPTFSGVNSDSIEEAEALQNEKN